LVFAQRNIIHSTFWLPLSTNIKKKKQKNAFQLKLDETPYSKLNIHHNLADKDKL